MSRLRRNVSANVLANVWSTVLALVLVPVYVARLGIESYGLVGFYMSWVAIMGIVDTSLSTTALRETAWLSARPAERGRIPSLLRTLEVTYWIAMSVFGAALLCAAWWYGETWFQVGSVPPASVRDALMLMVIALTIQAPSGLYLGGLMGLQRQVEASGLVATFGTLRGIGAVVVLWAFSPDIRVFFLWQIAASVVQTSLMRAVLMRATHVPGGPPPRFSVQMLMSVRQFAGATSVITALSLVLAQGDKMILSRLVSLESFGYYAVAWTVASGLSRVTTPLLQAFSPRFTELLSEGDLGALGRQVRIASQLTNVLVLPPAALLVIATAPVLTAWLGRSSVVAGATPLLAVLAAGTLLTACSYPALSVLYSKTRLMPVIVVNAVGVLLLLPLCAWAVVTFGAEGAAWCWVLNGFLSYLVYQAIGLRDLNDARLSVSVLRDFLPPAATSTVIALLTSHWSTQVSGRLALAAVLSAGLTVGWIAALISCRDLGRIAMDTLGWRSVQTRMSS